MAHRKTARKTAADERMQAWEQMPRESAPAFAAFAVYQDLGRERSLRKVAGQLGKQTSQIERWSQTWRWVSRARAYDHEFDRQVMAALVDKHTKALAAALAAAQQPMAALGALMQAAPRLPQKMAREILSMRPREQFASYVKLMKLIVRTSMALPNLI
jgi:hypothetical protein